MTPRNRKRKTVKPKTSQAPRKRKPGDAYQDAVAEVARALDPSAHVEVGRWMQGPDGRRDMDVVSRAHAGDATPQFVIECKDWTRAIGIERIDALESKRRDLGIDRAMICSNSGFTADALRKAARVGIPCLAAMIERDQRIRVVIRDQIYTRVVTLNIDWLRLRAEPLTDEGEALLQNSDFPSSLTYQGKRLEAWVQSKVDFLASLAAQDRSVIVETVFKGPVTFESGAIAFAVTGFDVAASFIVQWMTQMAEVGASQAMHDYLRKITVFGPRQSNARVTLDATTWGTAVRLDEVPAHLQIPINEWTPSEPDILRMEFAEVTNAFIVSPTDVPDLEPLIERQDVRDR